MSPSQHQQLPLKFNHSKLSYTEKLQIKESDKYYASDALLQKPGSSSSLVNPIPEAAAVYKETSIAQSNVTLADDTKHKSTFCAGQVIWTEWMSALGYVIWP